MSFFLYNLHFFKLCLTDFPRPKSRNFYMLLLKKSMESKAAICDNVI